jgi:hypothetical protein
MILEQRRSKTTQKVLPGSYYHHVLHTPILHGQNTLHLLHPQGDRCKFQHPQNRPQVFMNSR